MNPQEPMIPDPISPAQDPGGPVGDPADPDRPTEYEATSEQPPEQDDAYDQADADSFPASDPPAASEPGSP